MPRRVVLLALVAAATRLHLTRRDQKAPSRRLAARRGIELRSAA